MARTIRDVLPEFVNELVSLIRAGERPQLADQVAALPVVGRCTCGQSDCAHFYTAPPPNGAYPPGHSCIVLDAQTGLIVLDIVGDRIVGIEVLDRPDVKAPLDAYLPRQGRD